MSRWISVAEALPDDDCAVLTATLDGEVWIGYFHAGEWYELDEHPRGDITHWQHFPLHPEEEAAR